MANKPAPKNWNDVQLTIAAGSMALTLTLWNLFAGPDRAEAVKRAQDLAALPPAQPTEAVAPAPAIEVQPAIQQGNGPILLGGSAPQTQVVVTVGGGGGGGAPATSTSSS